MSLNIYIFEKKGEVSGVYGVISRIPLKDGQTVEEVQKANKQVILDYFRFDREKGVYGAGVPDINPSKDSKDVKLLYDPVFYRQKIAREIPHKISNTVTLIDSFACFGTRFGLKNIRVFVEVYESNCGPQRIWANIYYVADSEIPACIITVNPYSIFADSQQ